MAASTDNELILIGGGVSGVASYLAEKAGGEIGVVALGVEEPLAEHYMLDKTELFGSLGCQVRQIRTREDLDGLRLVLYPGGDQNRLAAELKRSGIHRELLEWWRKGEVIIAGSSAGAMVLCGVMLEEASEEAFGRKGMSLTYGLGPLGAAFIVPHFAQWSTPEWREQLAAEHGEGYYIFGIDEGTAMVWRAGRCEVIGQGKVYALGRMEGEWDSGEKFEIARGF